MLAKRGATIQAYDPTAPAGRESVHLDRIAGIELCASPVAAALDADVVVVLTEWPEFREIDLAALGAAMRGKRIVDCRNLLEPAAVRDAGLGYDGVGRA
jgi:UDPglucose 6-dehydrogenase